MIINRSDMHWELKVQYAWEYIMLKYGKNFADTCLELGGMATRAQANPRITVKELAGFAMKAAA